MAVKSYKTLQQFMAAVERSISRRAYGLTSSDLDDYCYADDWEDGISPSTTAARALAAAGMSD